MRYTNLETAGVYVVESVVENVNEPTNSWCQPLYEAKAAAFVLYGRALGLSHFESEDVVQETFIALIKLPQRPREPEYYALRCFRNRALNHRRSLWRRLTRELESKRWFERSDPSSPQEEAAMRALARLPADQREVIVLKIWHRHTFEEIGQLLDVSPNTVAGRYRYGLQKLKESLRQSDYERIDPLGEPITFLETASALGRP